MAHQHNIYDSDLHFVIDPISRKINNLGGKITLMQNDHNSERFTFEIPRMVEGHDMSESTEVQIHYINYDGSNKSTKNASIYLPNDLQVSPEADDTVIFSWLISRNSTQFAGSLAFAVRFVCFDEENGVDVIYQWFSDIFEGIKVVKSIYNTTIFEDDYGPDVLAEWKREIHEMVMQWSPVELPAKIDKIISGETQVGNANKLGVTKLTTSILAYALTLQAGKYFVQLAGDTYTGNDLPNAYYASSGATIDKRSSGVITVTLTGINAEYDIVHNKYINNEWIGWQTELNDSNIANYSPVRVNLRHTIQLTSYRRSVIALCNTSEPDKAINSYSAGKITFHQNNGLAGSDAVADLYIYGDHRSDHNVVGFISYADSSPSSDEIIRLCTFSYEGKTYGGVEVFISVAEASIIDFYGITNFDIFGLDYYDAQNNVALNEEVANSLNYTITSSMKYLVNGGKVVTEKEGVAPNSNKLGGKEPSAYAAADHDHDVSKIINLADWAKASTKPDYTWDEVGSKPTEFTPSSHDQSASTITAGTFPGKVVGNATSAAALGEKQFRNIYVGTGELVSGTSSLTTGNIYFQYE